METQCGGKETNHITLYSTNKFQSQKYLKLVYTPSLMVSENLQSSNFNMKVFSIGIGRNPGKGRNLRWNSPNPSRNIGSSSSPRPR